MLLDTKPVIHLLIKTQHKRVFCEYGCLYYGIKHSKFSVIMIYSNQLPLFEYNLRITPPDPVYSHMKELKSEFIRYFGPGLYTRSTPHATIAHFCMDSQYENKV